MTVVSPGRAASAAAERDRVAKLLAAIEEVKAAQLKAAADGETEAAEYLALQALNTAEEQLQALVMEPGLSEFLGAMLVSLSDIAGAAA